MQSKEAQYSATEDSKSGFQRRDVCEPGGAQLGTEDFSNSSRAQQKYANKSAIGGISADVLPEQGRAQQGSLERHQAATAAAQVGGGLVGLLDGGVCQKVGGGLDGLLDGGACQKVVGRQLVRKKEVI